MLEKRFENKKIVFGRIGELKRLKQKNKNFFAGIFKFENHKKFKLKNKMSI